MRIRTRFIQLCLVSAVVAWFVAAPAARAGVTLGQALPAFTKSLLGGGTVSPSQYSGKVLVLALVGYA